PVVAGVIVSRVSQAASIAASSCALDMDVSSLQVSHFTLAYKHAKRIAQCGSVAMGCGAIL
ncbi:MAG: hypothetical protein AAF408_18625, partial [Pseudomonadota bacterium]